MGPTVRRWGYWLLWGAAAFAFSASAQVRVKGYTRKDGTYVAPHYRSAPNDSRLDNYSTQGNYNPYTGKRGTQNPYPTPSPTYSLPSPYIPAPAVSTDYYRDEAAYWQQKIATDRARAQAELLTLVDEVNNGTRSLKSLSESEYSAYQLLTAGPAGQLGGDGPAVVPAELEAAKQELNALEAKWRAADSIGYERRKGRLVADAKRIATEYPYDKWVPEIRQAYQKLLDEEAAAADAAAISADAAQTVSDATTPSDTDPSGELATGFVYTYIQDGVRYYSKNKPAGVVEDVRRLRYSFQQAATDAIEPKVSVISVKLGSHVNSQLLAPVPKTLFKPTDTVYISISTRVAGTTPVPGTLGVLWTYGSGEDLQAVHDESREVAFEGDGQTEFHVSKPDGWPPGQYSAEVFLDGASVQKIGFTVR